MRRDHIAGKPIKGEHYTPSCGKCDVPPWEVCACSPLRPVPDALELWTEARRATFEDGEHG